MPVARQPGSTLRRGNASQRFEASMAFLLQISGNKVPAVCSDRHSLPPPTMRAIRSDQRATTSASTKAGGGHRVNQTSNARKRGGGKASRKSLSQAHLAVRPACAQIDASSRGVLPRSNGSTIKRRRHATWTRATNKLQATARVPARATIRIQIVPCRRCPICNAPGDVGQYEFSSNPPYTHNADAAMHIGGISTQCLPSTPPTFATFSHRAGPSRRPEAS